MKKFLILSALAVLSFGASPLPHYGASPAYAQAVTAESIAALTEQVKSRIEQISDPAEKKTAQGILNKIRTFKPQSQHKYLTALASTPDTSKWLPLVQSMSKKASPNKNDTAAPLETTGTGTDTVSLSDQKNGVLKQLKTIYFDDKTCKEPAASSTEASAKKYNDDMKALVAKTDLTLAEFTDQASDVFKTYSQAKCDKANEETGCNAKETKAEKDACLEAERIKARKDLCMQTSGFQWNEAQKKCDPQSTTTGSGSGSGGGGGGQGKGLQDMMKQLGKGGGGSGSGGGGSGSGSGSGSGNPGPGSSETGSTTGDDTALWQKAEALRRNEEGENTKKVSCKDYNAAGAKVEQRGQDPKNDPEKVCLDYAKLRVAALKEAIEKEPASRAKACKALERDYSETPPKKCQEEEDKKKTPSGWKEGCEKPAGGGSTGGGGCAI